MLGNLSNAYPPPWAGADAPDHPQVQHGRATLAHVDCTPWLRQQAPNSIHAVVTDPPYGVLEYTPKEQEKLHRGKGGVWRLPPAFDGARRSPVGIPDLIPNELHMAPPPCVTRCQRRELRQLGHEKVRVEQPRPVGVRRVGIEHLLPRQRDQRRRLVRGTQVTACGEVHSVRKGSMTARESARLLRQTATGRAIVPIFG